MLYVGTSGFAYDDWKGRFYPPDLPNSKLFDYYAGRFKAVEINSTFYHIAGPQMMHSLVRRAEGRVRFAVKMSQLVTHEGDLSERVVAQFHRGLEPAANAGVLGAVLVQFPFRFHYTEENRQYLDRLLSAFREFPLVVEIRHQSWRRNEAWRYLRGERINLCMMDMPSLRGLPSPSAALTGKIAYIRFHGRNGKHWFGGAYPGAPYDYLYDQSELLPWVAPIKMLERKAETTFVFFNNHVNAQAPENAFEFMALMGEAPERTGYRDLFTECGLHTAFHPALAMRQSPGIAAPDPPPDGISRSTMRGR